MRDRRRQLVVLGVAASALLWPPLSAWVRGTPQGAALGADEPEPERSRAERVRRALEKLAAELARSGRSGRTARPEPPVPRSSVGLVPLNDLGAETYRGQQGGLYPGGSNRRPSAHEDAGLRVARRVRPLDREGRPDPAGAVVLLSIGMSNTTQEFATFKRMADLDPEKDPHLAIVDGAQGGMSADVVSSDSPRGRHFWETVDARLRAAGVSAAQVQAAWVKQAHPMPRAEFPRDARELERELERVVQILRERFPNLRLAYLSSRTYGGYATTPLNPEPFAYQSGFAVKWLIQRQIEGVPALNDDPDRGPVRAPWLSWGPYLWADGVRARSDGLAYHREDFEADGTHPAVGGAREKVAERLLSFFKTDPTARPWFVGPR